MDIDIRYLVYNFLDKGDFQDYLYSVHQVSQAFRMSLDDAEYYVRTWYPENSWDDYRDNYNKTKQIAEMFGTELSSYQTYDEFWDSIIPRLNTREIEFLLLIQPPMWITRNVERHLIERKMELKNVG